MRATHILTAKKWYGSRTNTTGQPLLSHVTDVARVLEKHLSVHPLPHEVVERLLLTALGHDLFEDTTITFEDVQKVWGERVAINIERLTNKRGDTSFDDYLLSLQSSGEEVRIVKIADIISNVENSIHHFNLIDMEWIQSFWIPLLHRYKKHLFLIRWEEYPSLGQSLIIEAEEKINQLELLMQKKGGSLHSQSL